MTDPAVLEGGETYLRQMVGRHKGLFSEILQERIRQELKWGLQEHDSLMWLAILAEEFGEYAKDVVDLNAADGSVLPNMRVELVQIAAVAVAILEDWDRRKVFG